MVTDSPIDPGICRLLEVFRGELDGVRFPEIDREVLEDLAGQLTAQHQRLEALRAELAAAEQQLETTQSALLERAREGLAYARLYAARRPALAQELGSIDLAPTPRGRKPRKPRDAKATRAQADGETTRDAADAADAADATARRARRAAPERAALAATG